MQAGSQKIVRQFVLLPALVKLMHTKSGSLLLQFLMLLFGAVFCSAAITGASNLS